MSIIDNLLTLLDDQRQRNIEEIKKIFPKYSKQVIAATLGRILSKKLINKNKNKFLISNIGRKIITENLNNIQKFDQNFKKIFCEFVIFNIPEKQRINRDIMRNYLVSHGYGRLHNTVWIKINSIENNLKKIILELKIKEKVLIFNTHFDDKKLDELIHFTTWNFNIINAKYHQFINETKKYFRNSKKIKIYARCLIYQFAKIVQEDPIIPFLKSKKYLGKQAYGYYNKLRKCCY